MEKTLHDPPRQKSSSSNDEKSRGNFCISSSPFTKSFGQIYLPLFASVFAVISIFRTFSFDDRISQLESMCHSYESKIREHENTLKQLNEKLVLSSTPIFMVSVTFFLSFFVFVYILKCVK